MDPPTTGRLFSPPSSNEYPESVLSFDPDAFYGHNDVNSLQSRRREPTPPRRSARRYSDSSDILPPELPQPRGNRSGSSYRSGGSHYTPQMNATGLPTPPLSTSYASMSITDSLYLDPELSRRPSNATSSAYFSISETDDPAVQIGLFPNPPRHDHPPSVNGSSNASFTSRSPRYLPRRDTTTSSQLSPLSPISPRQLRKQPSYQEQPQQQQQLLTPFPAPFTCTFRDQRYGRMFLCPPEEALDQTPLYAVEVYPNCFMPTSYITTVTRGGGARDFVGQFEMGISRGEPTVFMGQKLYPMKDVFSNFRKVPTRLGDRWLWTRETYKLHWDCRVDSEPVCYHENDPEKTPIAKLIPITAQPPMTMSTRPPATRIEIYTESQAALDEIVMSALIVERKRLTPKEKDKLWN